MSLSAVSVTTLPAPLSVLAATETPSGGPDPDLVTPGTIGFLTTFAIVVASRAWEQLFGDAELGLALHRTIHGEQGFRWERPLRAGDEVTATLTIDRFRTRGGSDMVGTSVALQTTDGELVCTATATFVHAHEGAA